MIRKTWIWFLFPLCAFAYFPTKPYLPPLFEFQLYLGYEQQRYNHIDIFPKKTIDNYFDISLAMALTPVLELGVEGALLKTTNKNLFGDKLGGYIRYLVLDDIVGDFISLTVNLEVLAPFKQALTTFGRFYQGRLEGILSASIGKEKSLNEFFLYRWWTFLGVGLSDRGSWFSPLAFFWQVNWKNYVRFSLFGDANIGWGHRKFHSLSQFNGYQKIQYRSLDIGANVIFQFGVWGSLTLEYARRIYAKLAPKEVNCFTFIYHFPFSIF